jgi:protein-disulfide isomerase
VQEMRRMWPRRLAIIAALVAVATAVIVSAAGESSSRPSSRRAHRAATVPRTTAEEVSALLSGIPQRANTLGRPTAPLTLTYYGDLECPFCRQFTLDALPSIIRRWVRGGQLKIEYLAMETATRGLKTFQIQQIAALAAGMQSKMWNFIEVFYHEQGEEDSGYVTEKYLDGLASQIPGLGVTLWSEERYDPVLAAQVTAETKAAVHAGFTGTPAFQIGHSRGTMYRLQPPSLTGPALFNTAIEYLLKHRDGETAPHRAVRGAV